MDDATTEKIVTGTNFFTKLLKSIFECRYFTMFVMYFILFNLDYSEIIWLDFIKIPYPNHLSSTICSSLDILIPAILAAISFPIRILLAKLIIFIEEDCCGKSDVKKRKWELNNPNFMKSYTEKLQNETVRGKRLLEQKQSTDELIEVKEEKIEVLGGEIKNLEKEKDLTDKQIDNLMIKIDNLEFVKLSYCVLRLVKEDDNGLLEKEILTLIKISTAYTIKDESSIMRAISVLRTRRLLKMDTKTTKFLITNDGIAYYGRAFECRSPL